MIEESEEKVKTEDQKIIDRAKDFLNRSMDAESQNRPEGLIALKFSKLGEQWQANDVQSRQLEARPCLTINKTEAFCKQVTNQQRQQRPRIKVHAVSGGADVKIADIISGICRHIEVNSNADTAYDTAFDSAVHIGWGYFRLRHDYINEKSFDQDIFIDTVDNPFSIYFDPNSTLPDGSDQMECLITDQIPRKQFKQQYPNANDGANFIDGGQGDNLDNWLSENDIRIAEYYYIETKKDELVLLSDKSTVWVDELPTPDIMAAAQITEVARRPSFRRAVKWCKLTAMDILEQREVPGRYIPVVPVYGEVVVIEGKRRRFGLVKHAMDPQRMYNFWRPLALNTPIPTPSGWSTMGAMKVGDQVFSEDGHPCNVIGCSPIHINRECFEVSISDGTKITADAQHPWVVERKVRRISGGYQWETMKLRTDEIDPDRDYIKVAGALSMPNASLPIDPYVLGVWLGDGDSNSSRIAQSEADIDELKRHIDAAGETSTIHYSKARVPTLTVKQLRPRLRQIGVLGNKHIPPQYLRASEDQRWALLQGLMDTDGSCHKGNCSFTNANEVLANGFHELARSLGLRVGLIKRVGRIRYWADGRADSLHSDAWQYSFTGHNDQPIFKFERKLAQRSAANVRHDRRVKQHRICSVVPVASVPVKCIAIDAPSHLFLAGDGFIATHNTATTESVALAPKAKWLLADGQDENYEDEWSSANVATRPVLHYRQTDTDGRPAPQPQRIQPEPPPSGMIENANLVGEDLTSVLGIVDPAQRITGNVSGKALNSEKQQSDNSTFHYYDNLTRSICHAGKIILEWMPKIYDTERVLRIIGEDGRPDQVTINERATDRVLNDVTVGTYDVVMDTGPGYNSKRIETVDTSMQLLNTPIGEEIAKVGADLIVRSMDFSGADKLADRLAAANPLSQIDEDSDTPPQAQMMIKGLQGQLQQAGEHIQGLEMQLKYRGDIEDKKQAGETNREHMRLVSKAHDVETQNDTKVQANREDNAAWMNQVAVDAHTRLSVAEISAMSKLLDSHVKGSQAKEMQKSINESQEEAEPA